jgi:hypothetical protein
MTKDEALKLALEALEVANSCVDGYYIPKGKTHLPEIELAITAIKEALANEALEKMAENARELGLDYGPEQEPVAWAKFSAKGNIIDLLSEFDDDYTPLYTTPPQRTWVGLTDEEIWEWFRDNTALTNESGIRIVRAIEAKLKQKNGNA